MVLKQRNSRQQGSVVALVMVVMLLMSWLGVHHLRDATHQAQINHYQTLMQHVALSNETAMDCALQSLPTSLQKFTAALPDYLLLATNESTQQPSCGIWQSDQPYQTHQLNQVTAITRQHFCGYVSNASWLNSDVDIFAAQRFQLLAKAQAAAPEILSITDEQIWERLVAASPGQLMDLETQSCID